ncbi:hypothetical protein AD944_05645 [Acetobacter tropicalis]|nr:hypothetical protein AD944_05645 [Acetobacter tropicalis]
MVSRLFLCLILIPEKQPKTLYPRTDEETSMQGHSSVRAVFFPTVANARFLPADWTAPTSPTRALPLTILP